MHTTLTSDVWDQPLQTLWSLVSEKSLMVVPFAVGSTKARQSEQAAGSFAGDFLASEIAYYIAYIDETSEILYLRRGATVGAALCVAHTAEPEQQ